MDVFVHFDTFWYVSRESYFKCWTSVNKHYGLLAR